MKTINQIADEVQADYAAREAAELVINDDPPAGGMSLNLREFLFAGQPRGYQRQDVTTYLLMLASTLPVTDMRGAGMLRAVAALLEQGAGEIWPEDDDPEAELIDQVSREWNVTGAVHRVLKHPPYLAMDMGGLLVEQHQRVRAAVNAAASPPTQLGDQEVL